jgi:hypothetical protein
MNVIACRPSGEEIEVDGDWHFWSIEAETGGFAIELNDCRSYGDPAINDEPIASARITLTTAEWQRLVNDVAALEERPPPGPSNIIVVSPFPLPPPKDVESQ